MPIDTSDVDIGASAGPVSFFVDPDEVAAFALAVNDQNPRYGKGSSTPPTYTVALALSVVHDLPGYSPAALSSTRAIVHGDQEFLFHRPVTAGTTVRITAKRIGATPTKAGMAVEQTIRVEDVEGELLLGQRWVPMLIGEATGPVRGRATPALTFPEAARSQPVGRITLATSRDQTFRYAGASSDRNPMHVNDEVARRQGFPGKFNQGLLTLGIATGGLVDMVAGGDPDKVRRLATRFSAPAFPGDDIELSVYEIGATPGGGTAFAFEAESAGRVVLRHGRFEVRP